MLPDAPTLEDLHRIAASVAPIRGWDFSRQREHRDPVPWEYPEIVRRFLRPSDRVLDIATGGGEVFLGLAPNFASGLGTDMSPQMIATARENTPDDLRHKISFQVVAAQDLDVPAESFDIVLNRHGPVFTQPIVRALRPGGYFICQQVGGLNGRNIFRMFGWDSGGDYWRAYWDRHGFAHQDVTALSEIFPRLGCRVVATGSYDVRSVFLDLESLIFHLQSVPLPEDFDLEHHGELVLRFIAENRTAGGIETNEHRELIIVQKDA